MLLSQNNVSYYQHLMQGIRDAVKAGGYADFVAATKDGWAQGDIPLR